MQRASQTDVGHVAHGQTRLPFDPLRRASRGCSTPGPTLRRPFLRHSVTQPNSSNDS